MDSNGNVLKYRVDKLEETVDRDHAPRIRSLELGYAKLFALAGLGAAVGGFLANLVR